MFLQFSGLEHLAHDIAAADELALHVKLGNGRPVGIILDSLTQIAVGQHVDAFVVDAEIVENLDHLPGEATLRKTGRALHEKNNVAAFDFVIDEFVDAGHRKSSSDRGKGPAFLSLIVMYCTIH